MEPPLKSSWLPYRSRPEAEILGGRRGAYPGLIHFVHKCVKVEMFCPDLDCEDAIFIVLKDFNIFRVDVPEIKSRFNIIELLGEDPETGEEKGIILVDGDKRSFHIAKNYTNDIYPGAEDIYGMIRRIRLYNL